MASDGGTGTLGAETMSCRRPCVLGTSTQMGMNFCPCQLQDGVTKGTGLQTTGFVFSKNGRHGVSFRTTSLHRLRHPRPSGPWSSGRVVT